MEPETVERKVRKVGRPTNPNIVQLGIRLSRAAYEKLERESKMTYRSKSAVIEKLLAEYME